MAIARTFPTGFGFWQTCIVPTDLLVTETTKLAGAAIKLYIIMLFYLPLLIYANIFKKNPIFGVKFETLPYGLLHTVPVWLLFILVLITLLMLIAFLLIAVIYYVIMEGHKHTRWTYQAF
ncbi:uncharacterized protein [Rutidosis leptorrhynchoides]|uniref:uncharacterized protein isoform X3 n=1 Tax=Rutidosis leptorrhynchoides TaxID=125765 RepID=UPI003A9A463D